MQSCRSSMMSPSQRVTSYPKFTFFHGFTSNIFTMYIDIKITQIMLGIFFLWIISFKDISKFPILEFYQFFRENVIAGWGVCWNFKITSNLSKFTNISDDLIVYFIKSSLMQNFPWTDENFQKTVKCSSLKLCNIHAFLWQNWQCLIFLKVFSFWYWFIKQA